MLTGLGLDVADESDLPSALRCFREKRPDLVVIGCTRRTGKDALTFAAALREIDRAVPLVLLAAASSEDLAIDALRAGINDYLRPPFELEILIAAIFQGLGRRNGRVAGPAPALVEGDRMIGASPFSVHARTYISRIAPTDCSLLITGPTGTGKELIAELIHLNSARRANPFVCINCAAIPDTLLESELFGFERGAFTGAYSSYEGKLKTADGGTVLLDEIGDLTPCGQAKMLRVIETKEAQRLGGRGATHLNIRIIAATNRDLAALADQGGFRKDLYFRLKVASLVVPPLKDRKEDIPLLLDHYVGEFNRRFGLNVEGFTAEALSTLLQYDWPGNVRELKNLVEAIFIDIPSRRIAFTDLPEDLHERLRTTAVLPQSERERLLSALFATNWNCSEAAQKLRWSRMTLYRKMARYQISKGTEETPNAGTYPSPGK